jgi:Fic-DOC domain mobile mystery protein B
VSDLDRQSDNATPLTPEERQALIPSHVTLRRELNELEQQNILEANTWVFGRKRNPVDEGFGRHLHRRMFGKIWRCAGTYRTTNKNIGDVDRTMVQPRIYEAYNNIRFWMDQKTFSPDELAVRFHHALVFVHPFPDGNGRWSRLMADVLAVRLGQSRFTWGGSSLRAHDETRDAYMQALKAADNHDFTALLAFARS